MALPPINPITSQQIKDLDLDNHKESYDKITPWTTRSATIAVSLLVPSLIVIVCSGLCFTLTNSVNGLIFKGIVPGSGGVLLSVPFFVIMYLNSTAQTKMRRELIDKMVGILEQNNVKNQPQADDSQKQQAQFIRDHFLRKEWNIHFTNGLLLGLLARYKKDKDEDKSIRAAIEKAKKDIEKDTYKTDEENKT